MKTLIAVLLCTVLAFAQAAYANINADIVNAATGGQLETLQELLGQSKDIEADSLFAVNMAAFAALDRQGKGEPFADQVEAIRMLARAGANVDEHMGNGITALMLMAILEQMGIRITSGGF